MLLGTHLTMLIGRTVPVPAPQALTEALQSMEVTHKDQGRSGFQVTFQIGRSGPLDLLDYAQLQNPLLRPFSRVVLIVTFTVAPAVLMDGMITNVELSPGTDPGTATLSVTGEDVSIMLDLEKKRVEHPAQDETLIALKILASHLQYFLSPPTVIPPVVIDPPIPIERTPVQQGTDLEYLNEMAGRHGYVFYVEPGPLPLMNRAYWGPPPRLSVPQPALSVNMGHETNVESISFQYNALAPTTVKGEVQDRLTNQKLPVQTFASLRPPLVPQPALPFNLPNVRTSLLEQSEGLSYVQAFARAQATTDASMDSVVSASGELDALRYGRLLQPRGLVGLRGAGYTNDGLYYVKSVTHAIQKGQYRQRFSLTREGVGALSPVVIP